MKKHILIGLVATTLVLALAVSSALALGSGYGRGMGYGPAYCGYALSNLTPDQTARIQEIQQANLREIGPLQQQLLAKKMELRDLWLTTNPDQSRIAGLEKDVLDLQGKLQEKITNARFETGRILTAEQQAGLTAYRPGMGHGRGRMGGRMGRW